MEDLEIKFLISGCMQKCRKAENRLYHKYYRFAHVVCLRYLHNTTDAIEVVNAGFLKAFANIKDFKWNGTFRSWIGRIMVNEALSYIKRNKFSRYSTEFVHDPVAAESADSKMLYRDLLLHIKQLPDVYQCVFRLHVVEGYNHREIGELMSISAGASRAYLHRAFVTLRRRLA